MQTSVQITFALEIAAMQLTPSFKMDVLKVRPTSKLVSMRLGSSQQPQPARPTATGSPSFAVDGLQVVPNIDTPPVQLTPLQGGATVFVTAACQISTVELSPSLEIASIILN